jgi:hypothetical protein
MGWRHGSSGRVTHKSLISTKPLLQKKKKKVPDIMGDKKEEEKRRWSTTVTSEIVKSRNTPPIVDGVRNKSVPASLRVAMVTNAELKIVTDLDWEDWARNVSRYGLRSVNQLMSRVTRVCRDLEVTTGDLLKTLGSRIERRKGQEGNGFPTRDFSLNGLLFHCAQR